MALLLLFALAVLQGAGFFSFYGIAVNGALIALAAYAFSDMRLFPYCLAIASGALGFAPVTGWLPIVAFAAAALFAYLARRVLPLALWAGYHSALLVSLIIFYTVLAPHFFAYAPMVFARELVYTMVCGGLLYFFALRTYAERPRS